MAGMAGLLLEERPFGACVLEVPAPTGPMRLPAPPGPVRSWLLYRCPALLERCPLSVSYN